MPNMGQMVLMLPVSKNQLHPKTTRLVESSVPGSQSGRSKGL